jgi:hypothetical protein
MTRWALLLLPCSPSLAGGRLYDLGGKTGEEFLHCLDARAGGKVAVVKLGKVGEMKGSIYPGPHSAPAVALLFCSDVKAKR